MHRDVGQRVNRPSFPYLGKSTIVPDVALVGEAVADKAQLALLDVLLDGVEDLVLGDLELGVGPAGDLDNHVEDVLGGVGKQGHVVEGRDGGTVLLWKRGGVALGSISGVEG